MLVKIPRLTLTWDVFKFRYCDTSIIAYNRLTLTWDVFKSSPKYSNRITST